MEVSCKQDPYYTVNPDSGQNLFSGTLVQPPRKLSDIYANDSAKYVFNYLIDIYGKRVLSGQQDLVETIKTITGKNPAVGNFDLMDYSPSRQEFGAQPEIKTEEIIDWAKNSGAIISLSWHWNAPGGLINEPGNEWWKGFYTSATTFDLSSALGNKNSDDYALLLRDMDTIAYELKKYQEAGIPILWRPLHEASGKWFWWGAKGPEPLKELWQIMYNRYTNYHQLHNLIWVYTFGNSKENSSWYPDDKYVDVVGIDVYDGKFSTHWKNIQTRFNGKKMVTLSETGTFQDMDNLRAEKTWWVYFNLWDISKVTNNEIVSIYGDTTVITADELFK